MHPSYCPTVCANGRVTTNSVVRLLFIVVLTFQNSLLQYYKFQTMMCYIQTHFSSHELCPPCDRYMNTETLRFVNRHYDKIQEQKVVICTFTSSSKSCSVELNNMVPAFVRSSDVWKSWKFNWLRVFIISYFSWDVCSRVQKFPAWHTEAAPNGKMLRDI